MKRTVPRSLLARIKGSEGFVNIAPYPVMAMKKAKGLPPRRDLTMSATFLREASNSGALFTGFAPQLIEKLGGPNPRVRTIAHQASADKARAGQLPVIAMTKVGHGPNGETVVFETDAKGDLDKKLMTEYERKH